MIEWDRRAYKSAADHAANVALDMARDWDWEGRGCNERFDRVWTISGCASFTHMPPRLVRRMPDVIPFFEAADPFLIDLIVIDLPSSLGPYTKP